MEEVPRSPRGDGGWSGRRRVGKQAGRAAVGSERARDGEFCRGLCETTEAGAGERERADLALLPSFPSAVPLPLIRYRLLFSLLTPPTPRHLVKPLLRDYARRHSSRRTKSASCTSSFRRRKTSGSLPTNSRRNSPPRGGPRKGSRQARSCRTWARVGLAVAERGGREHVVGMGERRVQYRRRSASQWTASTTCRLAAWRAENVVPQSLQVRAVSEPGRVGACRAVFPETCADNKVEVVESDERRRQTPSARVQCATRGSLRAQSASRRSPLASRTLSRHSQASGGMSYTTPLKFAIPPIRGEKTTNPLVLLLPSLPSSSSRTNGGFST